MISLFSTFIYLLNIFLIYIYNFYILNYRFYFKPQVELLMNKNYFYRNNKDTIKKDITVYKNKLIRMHENIYQTECETKKRREYELKKLIKSNIPDISESFDFTDLPYKIYSCIQFYLNKGSNSISYSLHPHPMEIMSSMNIINVEYQIRNSYIKSFENSEYLKLTDILKMIKLNFQNKKIWDTIFQRLRKLYHINIEHCQNCLLFHFWFVEYQNINQLLSKEEIKKYIEKSIEKIIKIKESEEKINESLKYIK